MESTTTPPPDPASSPRDLFQSTISILGSLWLGALLLMLLLVAMACATFFESRHDLAFARDAFYESWWFIGLLMLVAVNVTLSIVGRLPLTAKRLGFLCTHAGLLVIVAGALMTAYLSVDGVLAIQEGQSTSEFRERLDSLTLRDRRTGERTVADFPEGETGGYATVEAPDVPPLVKGKIRIVTDRYLPDSESIESVRDDNPRLSPAVEISLVTNLKGGPRWLLADRPETFETQTAIYRYIDDAEQLAALLAETSVPDANTVGALRIETGGETYLLAVEACSGEPVPVGDTPYRVRVLRYLPHASVGAGGKLSNASSKPENPTVEVELIGPEGSEHRNCFAKFPDFATSKGEVRYDDVKTVFEAVEATGPAAPVEILGAADGSLYARFAAGGDIVTHELTLAKPVTTPWPGQTLTVHRRFDHARGHQEMEPVAPIRTERIPAVRLQVTAGENSSTMWAQRGFAQPITIDGVPYEIIYGDRIRPLGFTLKLEDFAVRYYPGGGSPRAFESQVTITDPDTGEQLPRKISMNHPTTFGAYTLYQTSYQIGRGRDLSIFSVARDPGLPVVFAGYVITFLGMVWVLLNRVGEHRKIARLLAQQEKA